MKKNIENGTPNQSNEDLDKFFEDKFDEIDRTHRHANLILSTHSNEMSLQKLRKTRAEIKSYCAEFIKQLKLKSTKYNPAEFGKYSKKFEKLELLSNRLLKETLRKLRKEIFERKIYSVQRALCRFYKKKFTPVYNSFNQKYHQILERARSCHQTEEYSNYKHRNLEKLKSLKKSTLLETWEKIRRLKKDKDLCQKYRECKKIISKSIFEASKIQHLNFSLINKSFRKYSRPRKFFPSVKVKKVNQAYHEKSISNITALNKKKILNEKKWTSKINEIDQLVNNIVTSSSMRYNWKYRKKFVLLFEESLVKI